jgi:tRNA modification GTPase
MADEIDRHIAGFRSAEIIRDGFEVVILGPPNAGKSSLFNALAQRDAAIVTDEPGTTRDLLEVTLELEGLRVRLTDTAGLRDGPGRVEAIGMEKARAKAREADLLLFLQDMADPVDFDLQAEIPALRVGTKADLLVAETARDAARRYDFVISIVNRTGLHELLAEIGRRALDAAGNVGDVLPSRLRHVELLGEANRYLRRAVHGDVGHPELRAEELRLAADQLGRIVGAVDVEDLLDVIFSQFCIGK